MDLLKWTCAMIVLIQFGLVCLRGRRGDVRKIELQIGSIGGIGISNYLEIGVE